MRKYLDKHLPIHSLYDFALSKYCFLSPFNYPDCSLKKVYADEIPAQYSKDEQT